MNIRANDCQGEQLVYTPELRVGIAMQTLRSSIAELQGCLRDPDARPFIAQEQADLTGAALALLLILKNVT